MSAWYEIQNIDTLDTPALTVFPDRVQKNIETAIGYVGDVKRLRPHIKTHKSPDVLRLMLEAGITKFKCATIAEAEILGAAGAPDVLLAYQPQGPKLHRFVAVMKAFPQTSYSCLADNEKAAREMAQVFAKASLHVPVYLDLNVGMNRTGIEPDDAAASLYTLLTQLSGVYPAGLHAYDGHLKQPDFAERTRVCDQGFQLVEKLKAQLLRAGLSVPTIIVGGSPGFPIHAKRKEVECSPGTFIYWDQGYSVLCPEQAFLPAAVLVTRIISLPAPGRVCTDLGHKSVGAEQEIIRRVHFLNASDLTPVGQSEEHLVLEAPTSHHHYVGEVLYGIPYHICPTVALYERVITIRNGRASGEWMNSARDRKITY
jgi:D-serine deaminase-like pyridoxal phosphate-dependent protein